MNPRLPIEAHLPLVRKLAADARRSVGPRVEFDDLVSYGTQGLLEASERFDPTRGIAFSTFAYYRIRGAIFDGIREMAGRTRPERRQANFERAANTILQQAAEEGGVPGSANEAETVESAITQIATSYVVTLEAEAWSRIADTAPSPEARTAARDEHGHVREALARLPEKERRLLELMYFEDKSLTEAGEAIGLSKSWSSRLHARALKLLGDEIEKGGWKESTQLSAAPVRR